MFAELELLSKYRTKLMGIAAIGILAIHSIDFGVIYPGVLRYIMHLGLYGVDMFLLLSGMGLYYSMKKNNGIKVFYMKRMKKVLVPYLIMAIPLFAIIDLLSGRTLFQYISDVAMISFWTSGRGAWFVAMMVPLYIICPFIYKLTEKSKFSIWGGVICAAVITYSSFILDIFCKNEIYFFENFFFVYRRLPTFFVGWTVGILIKEHKTLIKCNCFAIGVVSMIFWIVSTKIKIPLIVSNYSWFALGVSCLISLVIELTDREVALFKIVNNGIAVLGSASLTMYLGNIFLISIFKLVFKDSLSKTVQYGLIVFIGVSLALLVNRVIEPKLTEALEKKCLKIL